MKSTFCKFGFHKWDYSPVKLVRYCRVQGCDARQLYDGKIWQAFLVILTVVACIMAAQDSTSQYYDTTNIKQYYDTTNINWKRSVQSITRDTASKNVTLTISPQAMVRLQPDTSGILYNTLGVNNIWKKSKQESDSALGKSMKDLIDTVFTHAGKSLKKQAK